MKYFPFLIIFFVVATAFAVARPISYPEGWTIIQQNDWEMSKAFVHYSIDAENSVGPTVENFNRSDRYNIGAQWNHLLARHNTDISQFNLYLKSQLGVAFKGHLKEPNTAMGVATDWETRRYFVSYEAFGKYADKIDNGSFAQKGRLGVAPYVAEYDSLHAWFMIQFDHNPEEKKSRDQFIVTPLVRVFKDVYLIELGVNSNGDLLFNWIIRF